jgi:Asp-tRNA(Asn)/Glu-tRNA(Gln) amidotransferase A subunit family amidase
MEAWGVVTPQEKPLRLAIPVGPYLECAEPDAIHQFEVDCDLLRAAGHEVLELAIMDDFETIVERHNLILASNAAEVHQSWFDSYTDEYQGRTSELIQRGKTISSEALQEALQGKDELRSTVTRVMEEHEIDLWITPSAPGPAPKGLESTGDPVMNLPWTQSGMPTVTLPSGEAPNGLPLGLQLIGRTGEDEQLLYWTGQLEDHLEYESIHALDEFLGAIL